MALTIDLTGRRAMVTGASGGLGGTFARALAASGAAVALAARRLDRLEEIQREIEAEGGRAAAVRVDVTDSTSIKEAVAAAEAALGPIDVLINNSGVVARKPIFEHDEGD